MYKKEEDIIFTQRLNTIMAHDFCDGSWLGEIVLSVDIEFERYKNKCNGNNLLKIVRIEVSSHHTNEGIATLLMNEVIKRYKTCNLYLLCHPMPRGECDETHKKVKDLKRFYSKFGFIPCGELLPTMIRKTSLPTLGEK